jgi:predicted NBD/HSP70 family sugar kinase
VNLLSPEMIIFDGDLLDPDGYFLDLVGQEVSRRSFGEYYNQTKLERSLLGRNAGLRGIGVLAIDTLLDSE